MERCDEDTWRRGYEDTHDEQNWMDKRNAMVQRQDRESESESRVEKSRAINYESNNSVSTLFIARRSYVGYVDYA
jgi:hypothetical protein